MSSSGALHYDTIVVGVGSMGAAACWFLAKRGYKVLGLEQFDIVHENGSHGGQSRIIRKAYFEQPDYVPLLQRAYENWDMFGKETGQNLFHRTGVLYIGKSGSGNLQNIRNSAGTFNISIENLSRTQVLNRHPVFEVPEEFEGIFEPDAGFISPEPAIRLFSSEAKKNGAEIKVNTPVKKWKVGGAGIFVETDQGSYTSDKLILTAGAWISEWIPLDNPGLTVTRQMLAWVPLEEPEKFSVGKFPCWFVEDPEKGTFYGFPFLTPGLFGGPIGLKLAHHHPGETYIPGQTPNSNISVAEENLRYFLKKYWPGLASIPLIWKSCLYTYSPDTNFIIDHLPGFNKRVTIACGFSGHGFKFASVVGEILSDLAMTGKTELPVHFLRWNRF